MVSTEESQKKARQENKEISNTALPPRSKSVLKPYQDGSKKQDQIIDQNNSRYDEDHEDLLPK